VLDISQTVYPLAMTALESPRLIQKRLFSYLSKATQVHPEKEISKFEFSSSRSIFL